MGREAATMQREDEVISTSPQRPDDIVLRVDAASPRDVHHAVEAARAAQREWASLPAAQRGGVLRRVAAALTAQSEAAAALLVREVGKPIDEARGEVARSVAILDYFAQQALDPDGETLPSSDGRSLLMARRLPRGVVGLVTPWNFPLAIPTWKLAPALAFGNAVVLKPSPLSPACASLLGDLLASQLPEGLFAIVHGGAAAGEALVRSVDAASFTGSGATGRRVAALALEAGVPAQAEMGGQNAAIVLPDADTEAAARSIAGAAMGYAGQKCTATSRVIVVGDVAGFTDALRTAVETLRAGDPAEPGVAVGPVISGAAREAVVSAVSAARSRGGRVVSGGGGGGDGPGHFVAPTLLDRLSASDDLNQREVFGPLATVLPASTIDEAVEIANGVAQGLVTAVYTADLALALSLPARLRSGLVRVNAPSTGVDLHAPFGGERGSGIGPREQGKAARDFYTTLRTVTIAPPL
jgi:aldehyde dehydrogenase (NAD+)